jgi:hypothetical protein
MEDITLLPVINSNKAKFYNNPKKQKRDNFGDLVFFEFQKCSQEKSFEFLKFARKIPKFTEI